MTRNHPYIIPSAEPFFFPGGPVGCLLVHGFTGVPKEMRWMGEFLAEKGCSVLGVRLAAHATCPEDMLRVRWRDWAASVEDGWHMLNGAAKDVFVMGLSMGGILSLLTAARFPVRGVVTISTPYALTKDWRLPYAEGLHFLQPRIEKGPPDWRNPDAAKDHIDYPYYPTRAIAELRDLLAEMRASLPEVTAAALLVHSRNDVNPATFDPQSMEHIYAALGSKDKQMLWVENSGHVITREPDRMLVFERVHEFIQRVCARSVYAESQ